MAKKMHRSNRKPKERSEQKIFNNYRAINEIRDLKERNLTPTLLLHLQQMITDNTLDDSSYEARFRRPDEYIRVEEVFSQEVLHNPPSAHTLEYRIEELCEFANESSPPFIHPVIKAIALHFAIGFIHPFVDGNGRTARAVFYWYMLKNDYWLFEFLPLSRIFLKGFARYGRAFMHTEMNDGDLTYFIHF